MRPFTEYPQEKLLSMVIVINRKGWSYRCGQSEVLLGFTYYPRPDIFQAQITSPQIVTMPVRSCSLDSVAFPFARRSDGTNQLSTNGFFTNAQRFSIIGSVLNDVSGDFHQHTEKTGKS